MRCRAFIEVLGELGFLDDGSAGERLAERTAPIQGRRWFSGVSQDTIRPFFGPVAWTCYAFSFVYLITVFLVWPTLLPDAVYDAFALPDIGLSALLLVPFSLASAALHEGGHWLAARAIGLRARFGVDRRMTTLVFETDLTQVWAIPRRQRYGPLLGGVAIDSVLLAVLLTARLLVHTGMWMAPTVVDSILATWVFVKLAGLLWQVLIFMRTDMYAVLVNALGCRNLWEVKRLLLRRAFGRLTSAQKRELAEASPADIRVGLWFRWVWLAGAFAVLAWFFLFPLPVIWRVLGWAADGVASGPGTGQFWYALACTALLLGGQALVAVLAIREYVRRSVNWWRNRREQS